jgi:hypothetical protein
MYEEITEIIAGLSDNAFLGLEAPTSVEIADIYAKEASRRANAYMYVAREMAFAEIPLMTRAGKLFDKAIEYNEYVLEQRADLVALLDAC